MINALVRLRQGYYILLIPWAKSSLALAFSKQNYFCIVS